jgi:hypothetical protein
MSFGLAYNGSVIYRLPFGSEAGIYAIAPSYMDRCQVNDEYKIGFTGTQRAASYSGSLAKRLANYGTAFIEFRIPMIITYSRRSDDSEYNAQRSHNDANRAEKEAFQFALSKGAQRKSHVSGNLSEWFFNLDRTLLRQCFDHMLDITTPGLTGPKPQPTGAWWFGEKVDLSKADLNIDPWSEWTPIPARDDRERRDLERRLEKAKEDRRLGKTLPVNRFLVRDLEAQLEAMLNPGVVRLEDDDILNIDAFDFEPNVRPGTRGPVVSKRVLPKPNAPKVVEEIKEDDEVSTFELFDSATGTMTRMERAKPLKRFYNTRSQSKIQLRPRRRP